MNAYDSIYSVLLEIASGDARVNFSLSKTEDSFHGNYATNIAFILGKQKNISPKEYAEEVIPMLKEKLSSVVRDIEVAGGGFINFFLKDSVIRERNENVTISIRNKYFDKTVLVEHSSPNLFKPFHVGHLMNNIIGMFITRAIISGGGNVQEMSFPSDVLR